MIEVIITTIILERSLIDYTMKKKGLCKKKAIAEISNWKKSYENVHLLQTLKEKGKKEIKEALISFIMTLWKHTKNQ